MTTPSVADTNAFARLFRGRETSYGSYDERGGAKNVRTVSRPLPDDAYAKHLAGDGPYLGVIPINEANECWFGAIDCDDDGMDLHALEAHVASLKLPLVVCRSKSGGAHLYLFLREAVPAKDVVAALKRFRTALGVEKNANGSPVEIFPKQVVLKPSETGNWINLPYYHAEKTNRYAVHAGQQLDLPAFILLAGERQGDRALLADWKDPAAGPFDDGPPCLATLHRDGLPPGTRNSGLVNYGIFFKLQDPEGWQDKLRAYNQELPDPLGESELDTIIKSLEKREYHYTCQQTPIVGVCKRGACQKKKFGIGVFARRDREAKLPTFGRLQKILTDPPRWRLPINEVVVELATDELIQQMLFRKAVLNKLSIIVPLMRPQEWDEILHALTSECEELPAPIDAGDRGLFEAHFRDFLVLRSKSESFEDLLLGKPFEENGLVWFRVTDLYQFLERRRFTTYKTNELYSIVKHEYKAIHADKTIKGALIHVWAVPVPRDEQSQPFTVRTTKDDGTPRF